MNRRSAEVLLIEDNPADIELTLNALRKEAPVGKVRILTDGEQALDYLFGELAESNRADFPVFILLDLKLPKVSGFEILEKIREDERLRPIPIIVLTSSAEECDRVESYRLGVNSYIVKPVEYEKFGDVVSSAGSYWGMINMPAY